MTRRIESTADDEASTDEDNSALTAGPGFIGTEQHAEASRRERFLRWDDLQDEARERAELMPEAEAIRSPKTESRQPAVEPAAGQKLSQFAIRLAAAREKLSRRPE